MGKRYAIWRRSRIGSALVQVSQPICSGTFGHGNMSVPPLRAQNYSTIRLLTLRVKFDRISQRTPELEHLPWTVFIRCIWNTLFLIRALFAKKMLLFRSLHFLSAFFHKISSNVSRNMLKIQTESYFHLTMSKWSILTAKLQDKEIFTVFVTLRVTWRQRKQIYSPAHPKTDHVLSLFCKFECFIRYDTWGTASLERLCHNMVRTWYSAMKLYMICFLLYLFCRAFSLEKSQEALNEICALLHIHVKPLQLKAKQPLKWHASSRSNIFPLLCYFFQKKILKVVADFFFLSFIN